MKKKVIGKDAYYNLIWSRLIKYDKYTSLRILPELSGILTLLYMNQSREDILLFYACWRDGLRVALRKLLDPDLTTQPEILKEIDLEGLRYRYCAVETSAKDLQDIMFWLIRSYRTKYNDPKVFSDSGRYQNIHVKESTMREGDVIERFH
jgi:hypothetical protein